MADIWRFIDEILREKDPWKLYAVLFEREVVLEDGTQLEISVHLKEVGTGRGISVSIVDDDSRIFDELERAGYEVTRSSGSTWINRAFENDRELVAEVGRWEGANGRSLRALPTRRTRGTPRNRFVAFPVSALALLRPFKRWHTAFAGADIRAKAVALENPQLGLTTFVTAHVAATSPLSFSAGITTARPIETQWTKASVNALARRMRVLLDDRRYKRLGAREPRLADTCFFMRNVSSRAVLRDERRKLAQIVGTDLLPRLRER